ncbi:MAG: hypothetical protein COZ46_02590 [Verrucomicrobia bacterium CG_4_10_14_3_um_filter_43_23]|nr:MAG: hypothetical protein AUJ82_06185 [Verrucomicrobia bacterium CG1_02_43_26]PIP60084.1 MAG: hypothetical protein COX01_00560 [Verrucomicrobia bacterium CG22_combo_CG10-13_8_21_14_all_43_17]PIX58669.1 MAG: hypothetical protein COZ46_02590 [Verrucomicrobia bacterium CG_4_10_14_3_um_filter_43_23]PIY62618.1 MAG: hypothetical protein COY94_01375 [Verrucomicrobia bacterium CG_4_10_14_0_8_um_filter_43_34]PJA43309.1 MAG: hypothetical protein CO175_08805 [Verrucomicrobia bacterium CG_4_9_14_3_um_fi
MNAQTDIHDILPPLEIPWPLWLWAAIIATAVLLFIVFYWLIRKYLKRLRQKRAKAQYAPPPTPYELALKALDEAQQLMSPGNDHALSIALSDTIRVYLEKEYVLPAPERTTEEFLHDVSAQLLFRGETLDILSLFLQQCDLAKFAKQAFTPEQQKVLLDKAKKFLEHAQKQKYVFHQQEKSVQKALKTWKPDYS